jgi:hypothetical protein
MNKWRTAAECRFKFRLFHTVTVPKGTRVYHEGSARHSYVNPEDVEVSGNRGAGSRWAHDTTYYYLWLPDDVPTEVYE